MLSTWLAQPSHNTDTERAVCTVNSWCIVASARSVLTIAVTKGVLRVTAVAVMIIAVVLSHTQSGCDGTLLSLSIVGVRRARIKPSSI
jgi:hypothetical protein